MTRKRRAATIAATLVLAALVVAVLRGRAWRTGGLGRGATGAGGGRISFPPAASVASAASATSATSAASAASARGCGLARASPRGETLTLGGGRTFHVWGPADYDARRRHPLVLAFHGWGSNGPGFEKWFKMQEHVGGDAFTVYPDARGANWDFKGDADLDFTAALIDALAELWCVDRANVLAFGFSYGGRFVNHLGCKRPGLVRGIVAGGGAWDPEEGCVGPVDVLVVHRANDPTMRVAGGRAAAERWAKIDGCTGAPEPTDGSHGCVGWRGCAAGSVSFCEDTHEDPAWPAGWNHTVRPEYRALAWRWFEELPR